jgi:class 3 adenylate cyclase
VNEKLDRRTGKTSCSSYGICSLFRMLVCESLDRTALARPQLSARIGIDSGTVVVGAGAGNEIDVFGELPNNAARVQALAAPGSVLISAATHRDCRRERMTSRNVIKNPNIAHPVAHTRCVITRS